MHFENFLLVYIVVSFGETGRCCLTVYSKTTASNHARKYFKIYRWMEFENLHTCILVVIMSCCFLLLARLVGALGQKINSSTYGMRSQWQQNALPKGR